MAQIPSLQLNRPRVGYTFFILAALYVLLFLPFWKPMILGFLFASACGPMERRLREKINTKRKSLAFVILGASTLIVVVVVSLIGVQLYSLLYDSFQNHEAITGLTDKISGARDSIWAWLESKDLLISVDLQKQLDKISNSALITVRDFFVNQAQQFFAATPEILLNVFIFTLAFAAFLLMGSKAFISVASVLGVEGDHVQQFQRFERVCFLSLGSVILTGMVQASLVTIGASICSQGNYFLIFAATFVCSLIPVVGAGFIPVVFMVFALIQGDSFTAVAMAVTAGITGVADNILKAWLFSKAAETNPIISLISLLGGIAMFGFAGLFIAPTIEQLVMAEYIRRRNLVHNRD